MPGLHHAMARALRGDGQAVELARQADGEVADVDHLLHFAKALGDDLAGLQRHQRARAPPWRRATPRRAAAPVRPGAAPEPRARPGRRPCAGDDARHVGAGVSATRAISAPSIGERTASAPPQSAARLRPTRSRISSLVMGVGLIRYDLRVRLGAGSPGLRRLSSTPNPLARQALPRRASS